MHKMKCGMLKQICRVARRECGIMRKNKMYMFCIVVFPVLVTFFFTSLMSDGQPTDMPVGVVDLDNTPTTRALIRKLDAFQATKVVGHYSNVADARRGVIRFMRSCIFRTELLTNFCQCDSRKYLFITVRHHIRPEPCSSVI